MIRDPLTGEHALLGTTRADRPNEFRHGPEVRCAFCPGNEDLTPSEIARTGTPAYWTARVFRNKYPAIAPPNGDHEVIVDARDHESEITRDGMHMWRERYHAALERSPGSYPVLFKNSGAYAGATILHPHTQLVVLPSRPDRWERMVSRESACRWCDELRAANEAATIVYQSEGASVFVRTHSRFASALTVLPHTCAPSLAEAGEDSWRDVAQTLAVMASGMQRAFGTQSAFNVLVYSDPHAATGRFHWSIEFVPRVSTLAGFELSTGMFIRGATAKESAARWRRMIAPPDGSL